jgi:hypothetical protein
MGGFMIYAIKMGSGTKIYIPNFIKIGSGIQRSMGGGYTYRHTDSKMISLSYFYSFKI